MTRLEAVEFSYDAVPGKFTSKERDTESGLDDFGARYYSSSAGRWVTPDWSARPEGTPYATLINLQTLNLYAMVQDNPVTFADLDGHACDALACDEFSEKKTIACSGNGGEAVACSPSEAQKLADQVPPDVKRAIMASVDASNSPTTDDKKGGFHEEGGIWGTDTSGKVVPVPAMPGAYSNPATSPRAEIDVGNSAHPSLKENLKSVDGTWHVHPKGTVVGADGKVHGFGQPPSQRDKDVAYARPNIAVGAKEGKIYFYNSAGIVAEIGLKQFMKE